MADSIKTRTAAPVTHRAPLNRGPKVGASQREVPGNETQPPRAGLMEMMFDADGYALTHGRHVFAASKMLSELIEADGQWPVFANELRDYLVGKGHTTDHTDEQIFRLEPLFAPWLEHVRVVPHKAV